MNKHVPEAEEIKKLHFLRVILSNENRQFQEPDGSLKTTGTIIIVIMTGWWTNSKPYLFCHPTELVCIQKGVLVALDQHHKQERSMLMQLLNRCRQDKAASKILQTVSSEVM